MNTDSRLFYAVFFLCVVGGFSLPDVHAGVPQRVFKVAGVQFGQVEPALIYTGDLSVAMDGEKVAVFEPMVKIKVGMVLVSGDQNLTKGTILTCRQRDAVTLVTKPDGSTMNAHEVFMDCSE